MKSVSSIILLLLAFQSAMAAPSAMTSTLPVISENAQTSSRYSNSFQLGLIQKSLGLGSTHGEGQSDYIDYIPNTPGSWVLGWSNRTLGIAFTASLGKTTSEDDEKKQIQSSYQDYQFRYFNGNLGLEFLYQEYRGFEVDGSGLKNVSLLTVNERNQADLKMKNYAAQLDYAYEGVSALEVFGASWEQPKATGAGYYLIGTLSHGQISSPQPFLPQNISTYEKSRNLLSARYLTTSAGWAASYIWTYARWYAAGLISFQLGPQIQEHEYSAETSTDIKFTWFPQLKGVVGYDLGQYYINMIMHYHSVRTELEDTTLTTRSSEVGIYFGGRF